MPTVQTTDGRTFVTEQPLEDLRAHLEAHRDADATFEIALAEPITIADPDDPKLELHASLIALHVSEISEVTP